MDPITAPIASPNQPSKLSNFFSRLKSNKRTFIGIFGILILVGGLLLGVFAVQRTQLLGSRASGTWSVNGIYGLNCSGLQCQVSTVDPTSCQGMTASMFFCPGGLTDGRCFENQRDLGGFSVGQSVDIGGLASQASSQGCGAVQVDWNKPGSSASTGDCAAVTLISSEQVCSGQSTPPPGGGGGVITPPPTPTPTPKAVCGESCNTNADCGGSTVDGIEVVCRQNKCVNLECFNLGGDTIFGTRCDCIEDHGCGDQCGADIGLCKEGYSCTYRSQSLCGVEHGYCVPTGTGEAGRGPMSGVPAYDGAYFLRRACGAGTSDPQNNYIYHASFPNHAFTRAEIMKYICNPPTPTPTPTATPTPTPTPTPPVDINAQCLDIQLFSLDWKILSIDELSKLKSGNQIYATVRGSTNRGEITRARFYVNAQFAGSTTEKRTGTNQFFLKITIPDIPDGQNGMSINIKAQLYHSTLKVWF